MYAIIPQKIPQDRRAEVNEKILFAIGSGKDLIPKESIYNCYTGIGGLHSLRQSDFASYHEYAEAKKESEMGQFFTPHEVCRDMVGILSPTSTEMVLDMCCGMGNFFNHLPNPHNAYGFGFLLKALLLAFGSPERPLSYTNSSDTASSFESSSQSTGMNGLPDRLLLACIFSVIPCPAPRFSLSSQT